MILQHKDYFSCVWESKVEFYLFYRVFLDFPLVRRSGLICCLVCEFESVTINSLYNPAISLNLIGRFYSSLNHSSIQVNIGPIHPSTHGVFRVIAFVSSELIWDMQPEIGLLHRGTEKLIEYRSYNQSIPYFNRLDYVSFLTQE